MKKFVEIRKDDLKVQVDFYNAFDIKNSRCNITSVTLNGIAIKTHQNVITREGVTSLIEYFNISVHDSVVDHSYFFTDVSYAPLRYANRLFFFNTFEDLYQKASSLDKISSRKLRDIEKNYSLAKALDNDYYYYLGDTADLFSLFVGLINKYGSSEDVIRVEYDYLSLKDVAKRNLDLKDDFRTWFIANMKDQLIVANKWNNKNEILRKEFLEEWPISRLETMTINEYVIGLGSESRTLCYELEHGKYANLFLSIKGGSAGKFGIYWNSKDKLYYDKSNKPIHQDEVDLIFDRLRSDLVEIIKLGISLDFKSDVFNAKTSSNSFINRVGLVTKLLSIYSDDLFFGVNVSGQEIDLWKSMQEYSDQGSFYKLNSDILKDISMKFPDINPQLFSFILWNYRDYYVTNESMDNMMRIKPHDENLSIYSSRLKTSRNIILRGAPGTGKTYLAKQIAAEIVSSGNELNHYNLSSDLLTQIEFVQFHPSYDYTDFVEGLRPRLAPDGSMKFLLEDGIFKSFVKKAKENLDKDYVFIIDEINRGEISKIFGELFYSIDPGYRGESGAVATQYSNLSDMHEDKFYVPNNVYLIGTMNDIDRSVDSFDFAMRRRFRFIEIKASENTDMLNLLGSKKSEAISRMNNLNSEISNVEGLNENYHIGPSYFLHLDDGITYEALWSDYLQPLVHDYIRGMYNEDEILTNLKNAYDLVGII